MMRKLTIAACIGIAFIAMAGQSLAGVDLQWRPSASIVHVGDTVNLELYAVSTSGGPWAIAATDVLITNNPACLGYLGYVSTPGQWLSEGLFANAPDHVNQNIYDGRFMYSAWANLGQNAYATPQGLLVTKFQFSAVASATTSAVIEPVYGTYAMTAVYDGTVPNLIVTGQLGSAAVLIVPQGVAVMNTVAATRMLPTGSQTVVSGPVISRKFSTCFYIEDTGRTCGIRVNGTTSLAEGTSVAVSGVIANSDGERTIDNVSVMTLASDVVPRPFMMNSAAIATGLSPTGLLVTLAGRVSLTSDPNVFTLNDGARTVRVQLYGPASPADGSFVTVTGALGSDASGPILRVNAAGDVRAQSENQGP